MLRRVVLAVALGLLFPVGSVSAQPVRPLRGHHGPVLAVAFHPDGRRLASGGFDGLVRIWDTRSGTTRRRLAGHRAKVTALAFSADGRWLVSGDVLGTLCLW